MDTHTKLTRPQSEEIFRHYFLTECYQGPQKMWHHKCGTLIRMHQASLSIHREPLDRCPGPGVVAAGGTAETQAIPYCSRCEKIPQDTGCIHEPPGETVLVEVDSSKETPILVWKFKDAPERLQKLSPHGGDKGWLALFPPAFAKSGAPDWVESRGFAAKETSTHEIEGGFFVVIGCHS